MVNILRKIFIKNYNNIQEEHVRVGHGKLAGFFGIFSNMILFVIKLIAGIYLQVFQLLQTVLITCQIWAHPLLH